MRTAYLDYLIARMTHGMRGYKPCSGPMTLEEPQDWWPKRLKSYERRNKRKKFSGRMIRK